MIVASVTGDDAPEKGFNSKVVRLIGKIDNTDNTGAKSFNSKVVRLIATLDAARREARAGFNSKVVRLIAAQGEYREGRAAVSIPKWCD